MLAHGFYDFCLSTGSLLYLLAILIVAIVFAIGGLIYWGIGSLVCVVFDINYNWTFLHGITT